MSKLFTFILTCVLLATTSFSQTVTENIVTQYLGCNTSGARTAAVARITLSGLTNATSYDFRVAGSSSGIGTYIVFDGTTGTGIVTTPVAGGTYSANVFTASGTTKTLWVALFPSSNAAFAAAATIKLTYYLRVNTVNTVVINATQGASITCLALASSAALLTGTALQSSNVQGKFVFAYGNTTGTGSPLAGYIGESNGITEPSYPASYSTTAGTYGFLIPTALATGVQRLESFNGDGTSFANSTNASGFTGTVNPTANTTVSISSTNAPLPVELTSFSSQVKGMAVQLIWKTASEVNNYGFNILRSANDKNNWKQIAFVKGAGTSNSPKEYSFLDKSTVAGKYYYKLKSVDNDGTSKTTPEIEVDLGVPEKFIVEQNYPNPFNPGTVISYYIPTESKVTITIFNALGAQVAKVADEVQAAGTHAINFTASSFHMSSGIYYYKLEAGNFSQTKRMILLK